MREILFRGKTKAHNKWVYGWYCGKILNHDMSSTEESSQIIDDKTLYWHTCEPETVGQFTGLTDKNGKKIFEGDVLDCKSGLYERCEVIYNEFCSAFQLMCADSFSDFFLCSINHKEMEIIGNIHDNPELLNGGVEDS